ncbi:GNAT family N-acetyltransferase [Streptomyces sp. NPDC060035]|uniref:GNAT family N-acetyltransferase n=1 Tax=Streptomyces sp. NPDC060035 TaxID=3347044 RepID=UPI00368C8C09
MNDETVRLTAGPLLLRPWRPDDIPALLTAHDDPAMRQWVNMPVSDVADAERWMAIQRDGWASGKRFSFAVTDTTRGGELVGNLSLKRPVPGAQSAEAGYWTSAAARGRGVAPQALGALTDWAFTTFAAEGLRRLELLHQVDNEASCRVAEKAGYTLAEVIPAWPPQYPLAGHRHVRQAPLAPQEPLSAAAGPRAGSAGTAGGPATHR